MSGLAEYSNAREMRDVIKKIARRVVKEEVPQVQIGKVYSVDAGRQICWVLFPNQTVDNLVKVRCAKDKIPTQVMATRFAIDGYNAPADTVRVWGDASSKFVLDFFNGVPLATVQDLVNSIFIYPEQFGAKGYPNDDTFAIQSAIDAASSKSAGGIVVLNQKYGFDGDLFHKGRVTVLGTGIPAYTVPEEIEGNLVALSSAARYRYGQWGGGSSSNDNPGALRDVVINGNYLATELVRAECVNGFVQNCHFIRASSSGKCLEVGGSQNTTFQMVHVGWTPGGKALSFDVGSGGGQSAGMIRFEDCEFPTSGTLLYGSTDPVDFPPHEIIFDNCLFEDRGANNRLVDLHAGEWQFRGCIITNSDALARPDNNCLIHVKNDVKTDWGTQITLDSCYLNGGSSDPKVTDAIRVGTAGSVTCEVRLYGRNRVTNVDNVICFDGNNAQTSTLGVTSRGSGVGWYRAINGGNTFNVRHDLSQPFRWAMPEADGILPPPIGIRKETDSQNRYWVEADGKVVWGNGSDTTVRGSQVYSSAIDGIAIGSLWRFENAIAYRPLLFTISSAGQAVALSGAKTAAPLYFLHFATNSATANVTLTGGISGSIVEILLDASGGTTGNSVSWPANIDFFGSAPQPVVGDRVMVTLLCVDGTTWVEKSRTDISDASNEKIDDRVAALLQEGSNITLSYNDAANTLTVSASIPNEAIDDRVAALLQQGSGITLAYDDNANTLTISASIPDSTEAVKGIAEIATQTETNTGTDDTRIVTPLKLQTRMAAFAQPKFVTGTSISVVSATTKGVTISGYTPATGDVLALTLTNGNTAVAPVLSINGGASVAVHQTGSAPSFDATAGATWLLYYNGTNWILLNGRTPVDASYANSITAGQEIYSRENISGQAQLVSQRLTIVHFTADKIFTAANIRTASGATAGSGATTCKVGLYLVNSDNTLTLLASSANTTSLWTAAHTIYTTALDVTVSITRNQRYAVAFLQDGGVMPTLAGQRFEQGSILTYNPRLSGDYATQTDLPASLAAPTGVTRDRPWAVVLT